jgi:uncharacterized iron-regulated protein
MRSIKIWVALQAWACLAGCAWHSGTERIGVLAQQDEGLWRTIEKAEVIYVGETHDNQADHRYELELVRGLVSRKVKLAIGWEMFDETQQGALDAWAAGKSSFKDLLVKTGFEKHWGVYSPVYRQILQLGGSAKIPNLALNAPPALAGKIARGEPLNAQEKAMMPTGFVASDKGYRNFVAMMGDHPGMEETDLRRYFDAQNVWDQTMASRILEFKRLHPGVKLVVVTGRGHVTGGFGIPFYVRQKARLNQVVLLPGVKAVGG